MQVLDELSISQCHGLPWRNCSAYTTVTMVYYRWSCGFCNCGHDCPYTVRVVIDQVPGLHMYVEPDSEREVRHVVNNVVRTVPSEERMKYHKDHTCHIELCADQHKSHHGAQQHGAHLLWKAAVLRDPGKLHMNKDAIIDWLKSNNVPDPGNHEMAVRCYRHARDLLKKRPSQLVGAQVQNGRLGGVRALLDMFDIQKVQVQDDFSMDTPYLVPGWRVGHDGENPGMCLLFTTLNLCLNWYRAKRWSDTSHGGGVLLAMDHTFKVHSDVQCPPTPPVLFAMALCVVCVRGRACVCGYLVCVCMCVCVI